MQPILPSTGDNPQDPTPETHQGEHPLYGYQTTHKGRAADCPQGECRQYPRPGDAA